MTSSNGVGAYNATVRAAEPHHIVQAAREQRVTDAAAAVTHLEEKIASVEADCEADPKWRKTRLAALNTNLETATAEADNARCEAQEGAE